ncbi:MAG: response regulator [Planctomycetia bacterium]|nr:response regulator [Planctomycetia bacterium]
MKKRILIVDDEPAVVRILSLRLKDNGYKTFTANDGYQAVKLAKDVKPDLILLDLEMPAGGGVSTFDNLKASFYTSSIPIIFITGVPGDEVKKLIMKLGADGFFPKPFNFVELIKKIEELLKSE